MANPKAFPCGEIAIQASPTAPACVRRRLWVLVAAVLGSTLAFVDESVVNVALPQMESDLHATLSAMQWVINAYTLCMSAVLLLGGAAADQFGRRLIFVVGVSVFAISSIVCGTSRDVADLVGARAIQGIGSALLIPCSLALIGAAYDEKDRGGAIGIWSGASALASGAAPLLGGWLVDHWSWRVIFLINPVLAVPTLWIALSRVPESRDPNAQTGIDWLGAALAASGLGSLVYGFIAASDLGWEHRTVVMSVAAGAVLLTAFVVSERHSRSPMMPLELFHSRVFGGINAQTLLLYGALGSAFFFLPFLLIQAYRYSATAVGASYLPFTVILGGLSRWSGRLIDRFGARWPLVVGPSVVACGFALLGRRGDIYTGVLVPMTILGFGMTVTVTPLTTTVINAVPERRTGVASGINNAVASVASLLLIAVMGSIALSTFSHFLTQHLDSSVSSEGITSAVEAARHGLVIPPLPSGLSTDDAQRAHSIVVDSLKSALRMTLWVAAGLALASAVVAAFTIRSDDGRRHDPIR